MPSVRADSFRDFSGNMWEISLSLQVKTSLYGIVLGILLCGIYDIIKALRKTADKRNAAVFAGDIIFSVICAIVTFLFLLATTDGEIRGYALFFEGVGFLISRLTLSKLFLKLFCKLFGLTVKGMKKISYLLFKLSIKTERLVLGFSAVCKKIFKKLLKKGNELLYTKKNCSDSIKSTGGKSDGSQA